MPVAQRIDEQAYQQCVLTGRDAAWELHDGLLVEKPGTSWDHGPIVPLLSFLLQLALDRDEYQVRINEGRLRNPKATMLVPYVAVVPTSYGDEYRGRPGFSIFSCSIPLVVEV